jgi:hypothetical protein
VIEKNEISLEHYITGVALQTEMSKEVTVIYLAFRGKILVVFESERHGRLRGGERENEQEWSRYPYTSKTSAPAPYQEANYKSHQLVNPIRELSRTHFSTSNLASGTGTNKSCTKLKQDGKRYPLRQTCLTQR